MKTNTTQAVTHVAIICDGNRRWAKAQGWKAIRGHQYAADHVFEELIQAAGEQQIEFLTFWVFSTENWNRSTSEVNGLLEMFRAFFSKKIESFEKNNIRCQIIGDRSRFEADIQEMMADAEQRTKDNTAITVVFAMNYGGRDELVRAARQLAHASTQGKIRPQDIDQALFSSYLDTAGIPDPDIIIRTSGEMRLSGFLPWQAVYSELFFEEIPFPEFKKSNFLDVLQRYRQRQRRFGK